MRKNLLLAILSLCIAACGTSNISEYGVRTEALDDSVWNNSIWISAADADVKTGSLTE